MDKTEAMGKKPMGALLLEFSLPAIAGMFISALYNVVDRVFIGHGAGVGGIAAVTAAFPVMIVGLAIGLLFSTGSRSLAAVAMGKGDPARAEEYISRSTSASFVSAAIASILLWVWAEPLLGLFGATANIMAEAKAYLGWILLGSPFQAAAMTAGSSLQAQGRPRSSFVVMLVGTVVNAALAPVFIFALKLGVFGAGLAVAISQTISFGLTMGLVQGRRSKLPLKLAHLGLDSKTLAEVLKIGLPIFLVQLLGCVTMIVANNAIKPYGGEVGLAVIGVVNTVAQVLCFPMFGLTNGAQPIWGYNYGAGRWKRVGALSGLVFAWTFALAILSEVIILVSPGFFMRLFSGDASFVALGERSLVLFLAAFILFPLETVPASFFQSTKRPLPAGILMISRSAFMIVGMLVLPKFFGLDGVLLSGPLSDLITGAIGLVYTLKMRSEIRRESLKEEIVALPSAEELPGTAAEMLEA